MNELTLVQLPLGKLKPIKRNARLHNDRNIAAICASLQRFGQQKPIVVTKKNEVVAGNGTVAAAQKLGWTTISAHVTDLSGKEARAFMVADNRSAELAEWDRAILAETIKELEDAEPGVSEELGFNDGELASLLAMANLGDQTLPEPDDESGGGKETSSNDTISLVGSEEDVKFLRGWCKTAMARTGATSMLKAIIGQLAKD